MDRQPTNVVYQMRCIHCHREQYLLAVHDVSHGRAGCTWCGERAPVFTDVAAYQAAYNEGGKTRG